MSIHAIKQYQSEVEKIIHFGGTKKETAIRNAFYNLLNDYAKSKGLMLVPEVTIKTPSGKNVTPDGTLKDSLRQDWGYWESKDEADKIDDEIKKKFDKGYPKENILFEDSNTAVLFQNGVETMRVQVSNAEGLDKLLIAFINFERPEVKNFRKAIELFKLDVPKVTDTLRDLLDIQEKKNPKFVKERDKFLKLCHDSINPEVTKADVREMIIQHILTEDIFNTIFDETQFHRENNIAHQLEGVINTFFTGTIKRTALSTLQHYSQAINAAAAGIADHHEKQKFLKVVYETFYKSYNPKAADRLGVVYTPNEIVKFMIESTDYLLHKHFNKFLEDKGVDILDVATGTGTFVCDIIDYIRKEKLEYKYKNELHANEVAILPYYISNLNIEFTYTQKMGKYSEFENLCFVDTLDNMGFAYRGKQIDLFAPFTEENSKRIHKQNTKKISVLIGNPPYNATQQNYNDNNANKSYKAIDKRIKETYIKNGTAQNQIVLYDMYTRFYRWAMDRLDDRGIIAFVTNNSFINSRTFDGFRKCVQDEFQHAYIIDLGGNIRELSGKDGIFLNEKHTIFGQAAAVGIAIMFLVKNVDVNDKNSNCHINYIHPSDIRATRDEKITYLAEHKLKEIPFEHIQPDKKNNWINLADNDFETLLPLIDKDVKNGKSKKAIFEVFSSGIKSQRDDWVYDLNKIDLEKKIKAFITVYDENLKQAKPTLKIKWDRELSKYLERKIVKKYEVNNIHSTLYRPFTKQFLYFDKHLNGQPYQWFEIFRPKQKNKFIAINSVGNSKDFHLIGADTICDLHLTGDSQCIPFHCFDNEDNRIENITDWGLQQFCNHYNVATKKKTIKKVKGIINSETINSSPDLIYKEFEQKNLKNNDSQMLHESIVEYEKLVVESISKEDIFYYVYAVLHNPAYKTKYELNLKREFPRIPFYNNFKQWSDWGKLLMDLHIDYEKVEPFELQTIEYKETENPKCKLKADKLNGIIYLDENTSLTGVPSEAWEYKLGNRSALEWVLDQYKESKPKDPTIAEKFNTYKFADYKDHVIDLLKRVCSVSVETMKIIKAMERAN